MTLASFLAGLACAPTSEDLQPHECPQSMNASTNSSCTRVLTRKLPIGFRGFLRNTNIGYQCWARFAIGRSCDSMVLGHNGAVDDYLGNALKQ